MDATASTALDALCDAVDTSRMMAHLREFARWTKLSGTREERASFDYLQRTLDGYGYATRLIEHDAYISLPGAARVEVAGETLRCITHSFSRPSPDAGVRARVVDAGRGEAADFAGRDFGGAIALIDGMARPECSLRASEAGCVGQIHVSPHEHPHEMCISPVWGSPGETTLGRLPRTVVCSLPRGAGLALRARLADGALEATLHAAVDTGWRRTPLLQADLLPAGAEADAPFVMFSGHHDTWYLGVMDNGGANATMLEIARLLAPKRGELQRGLRLCFWSGHSHGRYSGSAWYADTHWDELARRCVAHVNVDSTGARGNTVISGAPCAPELRALGREAVAVRGGQTLGETGMPRAGDQSFGGIGLPAMFMSLGAQPEGGLGWWWHTPEDTLDKIEPELLLRDTRVFLHTVWRLVADAVLPLDFAQHARDLAAVLDSLAAQTGATVDLAKLQARVARLARAADSAALRDAPAEAANRALVAASRVLVPLNSTCGDRFAHDPALPRTQWPSLDPIRRLAAATDADEARFRAVEARQAANRAAHALDEALAALEGEGFCSSILSRPAI